MAIGMLVVPTETALLTFLTSAGNKKPIPTPIAIAIKIQSVRKRSRKESLGAGQTDVFIVVSLKNLFKKGL